MATRPARLLTLASFAKLSFFAYTPSSKTSQQRMPSQLGRHALVVGLLLLVVLGASSPSLATTYTVNNTNDSGTGSLRAALGVAANGDTINFSLAYPATITLTSGFLEIATDVTIKGPGATKLFISGNSASTVFQVDSAVTGHGATISGVTIEDGLNPTAGGGIYNLGTLTISNSTVSGNYAEPPPPGNSYTSCGGGIYNGSMLTLSNSTVSGNFSFGENTSAGGGICNDGTLAVSNSTFSGNSTEGVTNGCAGGGIYSPGTLTVSNSTFSGNFAAGEVGGSGGGIYSEGTLTVSNSTFSDNSLQDDGGCGGGICGGPMMVINSTFSGNSAGLFGSGGGIGGGPLTVINSAFSGNSAGVSGGGIASGGTSTVINSTFSGNYADAEFPESGGGGIFGGTLTVSNSTFSGNSAGSYAGGPYGGGILVGGGTLTLKATLLANEPMGGNCYLISGGTGTSDGYNLSDDSSCTFLTAPSDQNDVATADLSPSGLQNNGGPTETIALLSTSTAVNAIPVTPTNECTDAFGKRVKTDQRGVARPQGPGCDIGAYELAKAQVTASPTSVSFDNVKMCTTKKVVVTLHNNGSTKVQIGPISFIDVSGNSGDFSDIDYCSNGILAAGKSCTIAVKLSPSEEAPESATLNIATNAPGSPVKVPLTGAGIADNNCSE